MGFTVALWIADHITDQELRGLKKGKSQILTELVQRTDLVCGIGVTGQVETRYRTCLNGLLFLPDPFPDVTSLS